MTSSDNTPISDVPTPPSRQLVLTLDGGGIRGYSSLLILEALMETIEREEAQPGFANIPNARGVSTQSAKKTLPLPCHYFDYIFGTSTGGLSAIMLGRLRMDVRDCLQLYNHLGQEIFGRPRRMHIGGHPLKGRWWWPRSKYNRNDLEALLKREIDNIIQKSPNGRAEDGQPDNYFPWRDDQCRTVVVAVKETPIDMQPFLFRSYNHTRTANNRDNRLLRNPGNAYNARIWQVARATTAAPSYFSAMQLNNDTFIDGGMGHNNPSKLAYDEVLDLHSDKTLDCPIQVLLNIGTGSRSNIADRSGHSDIEDGNGTGRPRWRFGSYVSETIRRWRYGRYISEAIRRLSDGSEVETDLNRLAFGKFDYYRLDVKSGLHNIAMDEWKKDGLTLKTIQDYTRRYLQLEETQNALTNVAMKLVKARVERVGENNPRKADKVAAFYERLPTQSSS